MHRAIRTRRGKADVHRRHRRRCLFSLCRSLGARRPRWRQASRPRLPRGSDACTPPSRRVAARHGRGRPARPARRKSASGTPSTLLPRWSRRARPCRGILRAEESEATVAFFHLVAELNVETRSADAAALAHRGHRRRRSHSGGRKAKKVAGQDTRRARSESVPEVPHARQHHREAQRIGCGDHFGVLHAAARLGDGRDTRPRRRLDAIGEREEGVGREDAVRGPSLPPSRRRSAPKRRGTSAPRRRPP